MKLTEIFTENEIAEKAKDYLQSVRKQEMCLTNLSYHWDNGYLFIAANATFEGIAKGMEVYCLLCFRSGFSLIFDECNANDATIRYTSIDAQKWTKGFFAHHNTVLNNL